MEKHQLRLEILRALIPVCSKLDLVKTENLTEIASNLEKYVLEGINSEVSCETGKIEDVNPPSGRPRGRPRKATMDNSFNPFDR